MVWDGITGSVALNYSEIYLTLFPLKIPHIQMVNTSSRSTFFKTVLQRSIVYYVLLDMCQAYMHLNPLFSMATGPSAPPMTAQGYLLTCANVIAWVGGSYCKLQIQSMSLGAISVALGLSNSHEWPSMYGLWSDGYTIRRFWR